MLSNNDIESDDVISSQLYKLLHKYYFCFTVYHKYKLLNVQYVRYQKYCFIPPVVKYIRSNIHFVYIWLYTFLYRIHYLHARKIRRKVMRHSFPKWLVSKPEYRTWLYCIVWIPKTMIWCFDKKFNYNQQGDVPLCNTEQSRKRCKGNIFTYCAVIVKHDIQTFQRVVPKQLW